MVMSFLLIWPSYNLVYLFSRKKSQAEILGKMDVEFTSDNLKQQIVDFKRRDKLGQVERYEGSQAQKELGGESLDSNLGLIK